MRIVLFDLFDTLLDKVSFDYDSGLMLLADEYFDGKIKELKEYAKEYREGFMLDRDKTQRERSFFDQLAFYEKKFGEKLTKPKDDIEWELFSACREECLAFGAKSLLEYLHERGYILAVLSNSIFSAKTLKRYMGKFGIAQYFIEVVSSADISYRKPSKQAFDYVLQKVGAQASAEIYFIGNKLEKDTMGALGADLSPILISKEPVVAPCIVLQNLEQVKSCFQSSYLYVNSISERESLTDGPGLRTVVFFQGCKRACKECHNPTTWSLTEGKRYSVSELADILKGKARNKKITLSGGEPLLQYQAIINLVRELEGFDICLFTGFGEADVPSELKEMLRYLKVGEYQRENRTTVTPYMGSSNQSFIQLRGNNETIK